jgi:hypothetical protein
MLTFTEWVLKAKRKKKKDEQRSNQTHGENGNLNQQGEVAGGNQTQSTKTVFVFPVPQL